MAVTYGELWLNPDEGILRAYDGDKWVTKEETNDPYLLNLFAMFDVKK